MVPSVWSVVLETTNVNPRNLALKPLFVSTMNDLLVNICKQNMADRTVIAIG